MADTFFKIGTSFPQGAFRPDGQPNIPSQAYADYLAANSMTPRADPVGYVAPPPENKKNHLATTALMWLAITSAMLVNHLKMPLQAKAWLKPYLR